MEDFKLIKCFWNNNLNTIEKKDILAKTIEDYVYEISKMFNLEGYVENDDYTKMINYIIKNYTFDRLIERIDDFNIIDNFMSIMLYEISEYTTSLTYEDLKIILDINNEIEKIQVYGHHKELIESGRSSILVWNNACACWYILYSAKLKKDNEVNLDANKILIPYSKSKVTKYLCLLNELPLYRYSYEIRSEIDDSTTTLEWILKWIETAEYQKMREKLR